MDAVLISKHGISDIDEGHFFPMHTHNVFEIYCFLSGNAEYYVEGRRYRLQRGDLIVMRQSEAHHICLKGPCRYERMCVHFDEQAVAGLDPDRRLLRPFLDRGLGKYNEYQASVFPNQRWIYYLEKICSYDNFQQKQYYLLALLNELAECFEELKTSFQPEETDRAGAVMNYINENLGEELSLSMLASRFQISCNRLNELFRQSVGTTVWRYIVVKRLFNAREQIAAGQAPTSVYLGCGFQDYSTFYRAYRQHFGTSPKNDLPNLSEKNNHV